MLHDLAFQKRLREARRACVARMQSVADWLDGADLSDRAALEQCGHRLAGTLGSFAFPRAAELARALEWAAEGPEQELRQVRHALLHALRELDFE